MKYFILSILYTVLTAQIILTEFWDYHNTSADVNAISKSEFLYRTQRLAKEIDPRVKHLSFTFLLSGCSIGVIIPVMPQIAQALNVSPGQYGTVIGAFAAAKMVGNIPSAYLVDRYGHKASIVAGLSLIGISMGAIALATSYEHLILARFISGFGVAAFSTAAINYLSEISTPLNRAQTIAPPMTAFTAGTGMMYSHLSCLRTYPTMLVSK